MANLLAIAKRTRAWACYDCGKCSATCPITRAGGAYSPRRQVLATNLGSLDGLLDSSNLSACLTCMMCDLRCPAGVNYTELVLRLRELSFREGVEPECPHGGVLQSMMRIMAAGKTKQDRLAWLTGDLKTSKKEGEVFYWTGCTMFFDALFPELGVNTLEGTRAAVRLLNRLGVTPVVSPEERCCGHDLLWNGDKENFERLAKHNVKLVADSGAETLVVSCAECLRTWKLDYEPYFKGKPPKIVHLTEYLAEHLGELKFKHQDEQTLTYQDPCRLGRHLGIYEAPRKVMAALPDATLVEMPRSGKRAVCCAGGTWSNCDRFAKHIQVERLLEARATGAEALVTACPKCQVHFRCAMKDPNLKDKIEIPLRDLATVVLDALAE
jgi:heterodisulfide reductase subunit D